MDEKYNEAELQYREALEKDSQSEKATYNLGNSLYKQEQYEPAITKYESLLNTEIEPANLSANYYNLGNSYFKAQKLEKSIDAYKQCLRLNPHDADAKHNLFLAQNMLNQQQNQQEQESQKNQEKDNRKEENQDNNQNKQKDQQQQKEQQDNQPRNREGQISKEDAERLLEALEQDEKDVMKKVQEQKARVRKVPVEKEW
ncbi:hypothetical protein ES705_43590 [subsurface metagenome]